MSDATPISIRHEAHGFDQTAPQINRSSPTSAPEFSPKAIAAARCAVADYLRDLGLRDPDRVALESQRLVDQARHDCLAQREFGDQALAETAIALTVQQLQQLLNSIAAQNQVADVEAAQIDRTNVVAARLPNLLGRYPQALDPQGLPEEVVLSMQSDFIPIVPVARSRRMRRQSLALVPEFLKRFTVRTLSWFKTST